MQTCKLETQTKKLKVVIDYPFDSSIQYIKDCLSKDGFLYALIVHDKDVHEDGELKKKHVHLVLRSQSRHQVAYFLRYISDVFQKKNIRGELTTDGICALLSESFEWDLQYLIHKNNPEKYQYNVSAIQTNLDFMQLDDMLQKVCIEITTPNDILSAVMNSQNEIDLVCKIGIGNYNLYSKFINHAITQGYLGKAINYEKD